MDNVTASEITFKKQVKAGEDSAIFIVEVRGLSCVMKAMEAARPRGRPLYLRIHCLQTPEGARFMQQGACTLFLWHPGETRRTKVSTTS